MAPEIENSRNDGPDPAEPAVGSFSRSIFVPVLRNKKILSWPKHASGERADYTPTRLALTREYETDAYLAAYSASWVPRRLCKDVLRSTHGPTKMLGGVRMALGIFDIDCATAHAGDDSAVDEWWAGERAKVDALLVEHPGGFVYRTRNGYRIVYVLPLEFVLLNELDAWAWSLWYCSWIAYLAQRFGIVADSACKDWTRLYRLPHTTRDEGGRPERLETIGDPNAIGVWDHEPTDEDWETACKSNRPFISRSGEGHADPSATSADAGDGLLPHLFRARGWLGELIEPGKWKAACPNKAEHTKGESFDGSTILYAPGPGEEVGWLHCSHAHCQWITVRDVLAVFSKKELKEGRVAAGLNPEPVRKRTKRAKAKAEVAAPGSTTLPGIMCGTDLHKNVNEAEEALARLPDPRVYVRARGLAIINREGAPKLRGVRREPGAPFIHALEQAALREHLTRTASWYLWNENREEWMPSLPPGPLVAALAARGAWPLLPPLAGIIEAPTIRADGSILDTPRYDEASGLFFDPHGVEFPKVPEAPTQEDAKQAAIELNEPFVDFEWAHPVVDLAVVRACMLTFVARPMFEGPAPCYCFDSTTRGSGKGLALDAAVIAATGRRAPVSFSSRNAEEQRKQLFALTLEGHRAILLDNITDPLGGSVLSAVLTSGEIRDRLLGFTRTAVAPFSAVLLATGNNMRFCGDFDRRVLVARQAPTVENPEDRAPKDGFLHPDLRAWVTAEHPRLVVAALTILRAYHLAGRPGHGLKSFGSFEGWDAVVRGACIWAGIGDPLACRDRLRAEADDDRERIMALLTSWQAVFGSSPATIADAVEKSGSHAALQQSLAEFDSKGTASDPNVTSIGRRVRGVVGRIVAGLRLERVGTQSPALYRVVQVGGDGGQGADASDASAVPQNPQGAEETQGLRGLQGLDTSVGDTRARAGACAGAGARTYLGGPEEPPATPATPASTSSRAGKASPGGCECMGGNSDA